MFTAALSLSPSPCFVSAAIGSEDSICYVPVCIFLLLLLLLLLFLPIQICRCYYSPHRVLLFFPSSRVLMVVFASCCCRSRLRGMCSMSFFRFPVYCSIRHFPLSSSRVIVSAGSAMPLGVFPSPRCLGDLLLFLLSTVAVAIVSCGTVQ